MDELILPFEEEEAAVGEDEPPNIENELDRFRQDWHKELQGRSSTQPPIGKGQQHHRHQGGPSEEEQAKFLFLQGVNAEQNGKLYEAIQYYRRAVQLVPDIEFRIEYQIPPRRERQESESSVDSSGCASELDEDLSNLILHFNKLKVKAVCQPALEQNMTHISALPLEVLVYIFKWVISKDLDTIALENLAKVCRGFYICARDEELWRLICQRVWGVNCDRPKSYGSWRNMFIERPHLRFHGCYISKMSYYRHGERGLDNFYKPFHLVEYYRYLRFFPEGKVLMLTTPEDPFATLPRLKLRSSKIQGMLCGYYKMAGNTVTAVMKRRHKDYNANTGYKYKRNNQLNQNDSEQVFNLEFTVKGCGGRDHAMLTWNNYSISTIYKASGRENVADFELTKQAYPAMTFSMVKSYIASTDTILQ